jgi:hypothetical protein
MARTRWQGGFTLRDLFLVFMAPPETKSFSARRVCMLLRTEDRVVQYLIRGPTTTSTTMPANQVANSRSICDPALSQS